MAVANWDPYNTSIEKCRQDQFKQLEGVNYLDHAGATVYSASQLEGHMEELKSTLYGNPHSQNARSLATSEAVDFVREQVLNHFGTDSSHYDVVFTSGCTGALRLLADVFPWLPAPSVEVGGSSDQRQRERCLFQHSHLQPQDGHALCFDEGSVFCYLEDNHTSVVGMREVALSRGAGVVCVEPDSVTSGTGGEHPPAGATVPEEGTPVYSLFAYPAMSNFSGTKYPLEWINNIHSGSICINGCSIQSVCKGEWLVVLDAAAYVGTNHLDLGQHRADFVTLSFYKMFGYPTGLGALLVQRDRASLLQERYFGGGAVNAYSSSSLFHAPRQGLHDRLEHGTLPFLGILALRHGFNAVKSIAQSMLLVSQHTFLLAQMVYKELNQLKHCNGQPVCALYHNSHFDDIATQGGIVNFNILDPDGEFVGYSQVDQLASSRGIHLRTGCFCNTGACQIHLGIDTEQIKRNLEAGHVCGDSVDIVDGRPTGSVRVSFGYTSTKGDAERFIAFIKECFVVLEPHPSIPQSSCYLDPSSISNGVGPTAAAGSLCVGDRIAVKSQESLPNAHLILEEIALYPIKSCGPCKVARWPLSDKGLLYDREWLVLAENGVTLSQKQDPRLCTILPSIDLEGGTLTLSAPGHKSIAVPLDAAGTEKDAQSCQARVCGERVRGVDCGPNVSQWLSEVLGKKCKLIKQHPNSKREAKFGGGAISFSSKAQFLMVTRSSAQHLRHLLTSRCSVQEKSSTAGVHSAVLSVDELMGRFRANLIIRGDAPPFVEDTWTELSIGDFRFEAVGACKRCNIIHINQSSGKRRDEDLLQALLAAKGKKQAEFGVFLQVCPSDKQEQNLCEQRRRTTARVMLHT